MSDSMSADLPLTVALCHGDHWDHVCPWVRVRAPLSALGWEVRSIPALTPNTHLVDVQDELQATLAQSQLVVIQRDWPIHLDAFLWLREYCTQHGIPLIYEIDDLLIDLPPHHPGYERYRRIRPHLVRALVSADRIICSTSLLAESLSSFTSGRPTVLPNYLDERLWRPALEKPLAPFSSDGTVRLAYVGGEGHAPDLAWLAPVLRRLLDDYPFLSIRIWGLRPPEALQGHERVLWDRSLFVEYPRYVDHFLAQQADLFVAPLLDNHFNRCKSGLKFLEYSALGVPGVYSALPPYAAWIEQGVDGFLARDLEAWEQYLRRLIEDPELRRNMGHRAWAKVKAQGLLAVHRDEIAQAYRADTPIANHAQEISPQTWLDLLDRMVRWQDEDNMIHDRLTQALTASEQQINSLHREIASVRQELEQLRQHTAGLETELQETRLLLSRTRQEADTLRQQLAIIENSVGWRLIQALTPLRYRMIPAGSRREGWLLRTVHAVQALGSGHIRAAMDAFRRTPEQPQGHPHITDRRGHTFPVVVQDGSARPLPVIAVLLQDPGISTEQLLAWMREQTTPQIVALVKKDDRIWLLDKDDATPREVAATPDQALARLAIPYVVTASPWLLDQPPTYLEEQITVLASEDLFFTASLVGEAGEVWRHLEQHEIPAQAGLPWAHLVVHRDLVDTQGRLDLSRLAQLLDGAGKVVGKLLFRPEGTPPPEGYPGALTAPNLTLRIAGQYVYAFPQGVEPETPWPLHPLHPVDTVLLWPTEPTQQPTVLMVFPFMAVGGAERVHLYMLEQLKDDARFVIASLEPHAVGVGTTIQAFRRYTPYVYTPGDFLAPPLLFSWVTWLIERFRPEVLYIANGCNWIYDALPHIRERYPDLRVANQVYDHRAGWINRYTPDLIRHIDVHIATNRAICQEYARRGVPESQIFLIEHCVDIEEYNPDRFPPTRRAEIRAKLGIPDDKRVVTFMARLHAQKRPMDFVELARRLRERDDLVFLLVGDGPLAPAVDAEIRRIGLQNVRRLPFYQPSSEIFAITDVYVLPSEYEGMPLVLLEAQAMGVPVVVTDVGNNREVLDITQGGVVIDRIGDVFALQQAVEQVLASPPDPQAIRRALLEDLSREYGILPAQMGENYRRALLMPTPVQP